MRKTAILFITLLAVPCYAATINVNWDGSGDYTTIQEGIDAAVSGEDIVLIANGTYTGQDNKDLDFNGKQITVESVGGPENCIIDCQNSGRGFYFHTGETNLSVVSGITIKNGYLSGDSGAAIYSSSSPTITNCILTGNSVDAGGSVAAVHCNSGNMIINDCKINNNQVYEYIGACAGAIYCNGGGHITINNTLISNNGCASDGPGGLCASGGTASVIGCTFVGNGNGEPDAAITDIVIERGPSLVDNCVINGGGIYCYNTTVRNSVIKNHNVGINGVGGAVICNNSTIENCLIIDNSSDTMGGAGIYTQGSGNIIKNCTIANNSKNEYYDGGGIYCSDTSTTIIDCILWGNYACGRNDQVYGGSTPTYSCIQDWTGGGTGNISDDPLFTTGPDGDYYLSQTAAGQAADSPCVNTGSDTAANLGMDIYTTRTDEIVDTGIVDMGYHYPGSISATEPYISLSANSFDFTALEGTADPDDQVLTITNAGADTLNWTITETCDWLDVNPQSGSSTGEPNDVTLSVDITGLSEGFYSCQLTVSDPNAENNPQIVTVDLNIFEKIDYEDFALFAMDWLADTRQVYEPNEAAWWKFDEGAGTTAYDSSIYGHDGTLTGDPTWTTHDFNGALEFDGIDDYVEVTGYKGVTGAQSRTVTAWINADVATNGVIVNWGQSSGVNGGKWRFIIDSGSGALRISATGGYAVATTNIRGTGWHHVAVVFGSNGTGDINDIKFYVDEVVDPISSSLNIAVNTTDNQNVSIGASLDGSTPGQYFKGRIDDVRIYDFALTDEMIQQIYNGLPPAGLICTGDYPAADLNGDCVVDINDLRILAQNWLW